MNLDFRVIMFFIIMLLPLGVFADTSSNCTAPTKFDTKITNSTVGLNAKVNYSGWKGIELSSPPETYIVKPGSTQTASVTLSACQGEGGPTWTLSNSQLAGDSNFCNIMIYIDGNNNFTKAQFNNNTNTSNPNGYFYCSFESTASSSTPSIQETTTDPNYIVYIYWSDTD